VTAATVLGFADKMRIGLRGIARRVWGRRGVKVRQRLQIAYRWRYLFLAVDSQAGQISWCWLDALTGIDLRSVIRGRRQTPVAALVWDRAPAHQEAGVRALGLPLIELPPYSPELNPAERVFEEIRRAVEGKVYATLEEKVAAVTEVLHDLDAHPERVRRLAGWDRIDAAIQQLPTDLAALSHRIGMICGQALSGPMPSNLAASGTGAVEPMPAA
jgi:transposase